MDQTDMTLPHTEADMSRLTGYSRQHLRQMRQGRKQVQGGKEYVTAPVLVKGVDYEAHSNRAVFYSAEAIEKLKRRRGDSSGKIIKTKAKPT